MTAVLIVTITVADPDRRAFERWYEADHFGPARAALGAAAARRGWSALRDGQHVAVYDFESLEDARRGLASPEVHRLLEDYGRTWGRVTRMTSQLFEASQALIRPADGLPLPPQGSEAG